MAGWWSGQLAVSAMACKGNAAHVGQLQQRIMPVWRPVTLNQHPLSVRVESTYLDRLRVVFVHCAMCSGNGTRHGQTAASAAGLGVLSTVHALFESMSGACV